MKAFLQTLRPLAIPGLVLLAILLSFVTLRLVNGGQKAETTDVKGLSAARSSLRYLRDLDTMILNDDVNPSDFDKKWRWAREEADEAKRAGFDTEITDNLFCSLAGYGTHIAGGTGLVEAHQCLVKGEAVLSERYER